MARSPALPFPSPRLPPWLGRIPRVAILAVLAALLVVTGVFAQVTHVLPFLSSPAPTYQTATVSRGNISVSVSATGPVSPVVSVPLSFKTSGKLSEIKVNLGQKVTKGQVLATLDPSDLQTALDQAKATLAIQQANLDKLQAGATDAQKQ